MHFKYLLPIVFSFSLSTLSAQNKVPWFQSAEFSVYADSVRQSTFLSFAASPVEISSSYKSPVNLYQSAAITFKFSINGNDNEMSPGSDHHFNSVAVTNETPVLKFGKQSNAEATSLYLKQNSSITIKVDMNDVLNDFKSKGFYTTYDGKKIFREDFKGVFVAGATAPMTWDFDNLVNHPELQLKDEDGDGIYQTTLKLNNDSDKKTTLSSWKQSRNTSAFPQYHSEFPMTDAVYNISLEEMMNAIEPDSTFRTGKLWAGVWTRDISYSILLSMAYMEPEVAKNSLLKKVSKDDRIIQDTGTGGAYPCSTDRMIWAVAAWEVYLATGDEDWLKKAYVIIKNSIDDDSHNAYDKITGMVHGESSFLDWREQTYPRWMQPADIYESENLGTNAVHYKANLVAEEMALLLHESKAAQQFRLNASNIKRGINNNLWMEEKGYYGQYLYGRGYKMISPRSEALGEALCVLFNIADPKEQESIISNTPVTPFGIPCIYPQIPGIPPYHNNAIWPFVESYWAMAAAKVNNETSVLKSMGAITRAASMFITNKENFVADNGDFAGTQINSSNMLWSLSGSIAMIHKVIFGIEFKQSGLYFHPFVPKPLGGSRMLNNFKYRDAVLDISLSGFGNKIIAYKMDDIQMKVPMVPSSLKGHHKVEMIMGKDVQHFHSNKINNVHNLTSPAMPVVTYSSNDLHWQSIPGIKEYLIYRNGQPYAKSTGTSFTVKPVGYAEYQVIAADKNKLTSFASEPIRIMNKGEQIIELEDLHAASNLLYKGFTGSGFIETSKKENSRITIPVTVSSDGRYSIDFRYANGNGPVNTDNKCGIRSLWDGKKFLGTVLLPQRGNGEWSNWGYSNSVSADLKKGKHILTLSLEPWNENMNIAINQSMLDEVRLTRMF